MQVILFSGGAAVSLLACSPPGSGLAPTDVG